VLPSVATASVPHVVPAGRQALLSALLGRILRFTDMSVNPVPQNRGRDVIVLDENGNVRQIIHVKDPNPIIINGR